VPKPPSPLPVLSPAVPVSYPLQFSSDLEYSDTFIYKCGVVEWLTEWYVMPQQTADPRLAVVCASYCTRAAPPARAARPGQTPASLHGLCARPELLEGAQTLPSSLDELLKLYHNVGDPAEVG